MADTLDMSLDDRIAASQRPGRRRSTHPRSSQNDLRGPMNGVRKTTNRSDSRDIDRDWVHDRFDDDHRSRERRPDRRGLDRESPPSGGKLRVDNLHFDVTQKDLEDLFSDIGPVSRVAISFDRAGRSNGVAYVTYEDAADVQAAIREYSGANAKGQPITLTEIPMGRNRTQRPSALGTSSSRSIFDRIGRDDGARGGGRLRRHRSLSPDTHSGRREDKTTRRSDVSKPAPAGIDRYVPGDRDDKPRRRRTQSVSRPVRAYDDRRDRDYRREGNGGQRGARRGDRSNLARDGRPRKTAQQLDAEMEDYFVEDGNEGARTHNQATAPASARIEADGDIDMIA